MNTDLKEKYKILREKEILEELLQIRTKIEILKESEDKLLYEFKKLESL